MMERLKQLAGPIGLALILFGGVTYGILYTAGPLAFVPLLVGIVLVIGSLASSIRTAGAEGYRRTARYGMHAGASIVFLASILILLQALSARHNVRIDTTRNKRFSLSSQTIQVLGTLQRNVELKCFFKGESLGRVELEELLKEYTSRSQRIFYAFIDPDKDPVTTNKHNVTQNGTIVVSSGESEEKISGISEETITNAILRVSRDEKKVVYFLTGHGEKSITNTDADGYSRLREALAGEDYEVRELLTLRDAAIPADCNILVIAGPEKDLFPREREIIARYLGNGGSVLVMLEPILDLEESEAIIADYGIEVGDNVIIDKSGRIMAGNFLIPVVNEYADHPITDKMTMASLFPKARAVTVSQDLPSGLSVTAIASTGKTAYAETNIDTLLAGKSQFEGESDISGPLNLAAAAVTTPPKLEAGDSAGARGTASRLVVFGDSDFAGNANLDLLGNKDLIMNTVNWLAAEENLIAIRAKNPLIQPLIFSERQGRVLFWIPIVGLPALVAFLGVIMGLSRRRSER